MLDCEGSFNSVEPIRSLSEMEPSGVSVEVTKSCTNKDHCQSVRTLLNSIYILFIGIKYAV